MMRAKWLLIAGAFVLSSVLLAGSYRPTSTRADDAAPELRRIKPETITAGAPTFTIRLEGKNFAPGAKVILDGVVLDSSRTNENGRVLLADVDKSVVGASGTHAAKAVNPDGKETTTLNLTVVDQDPELQIQLRSNAAQEDGGQDIATTIDGQGFDSKSTAVVWGDDSPSTTFFSEEELGAQVAAAFLADPARIPVMVRNKGGRLSNVDIFFVVPRPATVNEVDPSEIEVGTDDFDVKVFGDNFKPGAKVVVNGTPLDTSSPKPGRLDAKIPGSFRGSPGQLLVRVEQEGIQSKDLTITVTPSESPFIFTVAPLLIRQGGKKATIEVIGANFKGNVTVLLDGQEANVKESSRRRLIIGVGSDLLSVVGTHTVQVKGKDGDLSNTVEFKVVPDVMVSTLAGNKRDGFNLDQPCVSSESALFRRPSRLALGADGLLYLTDQQNNAVRSINLTTGEVCTIAGRSGLPGYNDSVNPRGFPPTFSNPLGVAVAADGTIYVTENGNNVVRRIVREPAGGVRVDTFAGTTTPVTDRDRQNQLNSTLRGVNGFRNGDALRASFRQPDDILVAPDGSIYLSDAGNHAVRRIRQSGTEVIVETIAGNGVPGFVDGDAANARFEVPTGLALSADGKTLFVADTNNHRVRRINLTTMRVDTLAGSGDAGGVDGAPSESSFNQPIGLALDLDGTLYVSEFQGKRIRRVDPSGNVTTLAGGGPKLKFRDGPGITATFKNPRGIAIDPATGVLYVADYENFRIRKVNLR